MTTEAEQSDKGRSGRQAVRGGGRGRARPQKKLGGIAGDESGMCRSGGKHTAGGHGSFRSGKSYKRQRDERQADRAEKERSRGENYLAQNGGTMKKQERETGKEGRA